MVAPTGGIYLPLKRGGAALKRPGWWRSVKAPISLQLPVRRTRPAPDPDLVAEVRAGARLQD